MSQKKGLCGDLLLENDILRFGGIKGREPGYNSVIIAICRHAYCFLHLHCFIKTRNPMK